MSDHIHALLAFNPSKRISDVVGAWKGYVAKKFGVRWQSNYFDHRIRNGQELDEKREYILRNPVVGGLCQSPAEWMWKMES